jgi:hypothetical protein
MRQTNGAIKSKRSTLAPSAHCTEWHAEPITSIFTSSALTARVALDLFKHPTVVARLPLAKARTIQPEQT